MLNMYRDELQDDEDLRVEIFHLKKQLSNVNTENHLLKVKIRKLQNEIVKKDREMDVVLDPRKSTDIRKVLYERSASFVLNMKEKNDELLHILREKDILIRRLQNQLEVTKLYSSQQAKKHNQCKYSEPLDTDNKFRHLKTINSRSSNNLNDNKKGRSLSWTGFNEVENTLVEGVEEEDHSNKSNKSYDVKEQYKSLTREHLLSIIENLKNNQGYSSSSQQTTSRKSSPESDLERIELLCESPHEEIKQLHFHFLDMISEVDLLKNRIIQLQNNQEKTDNVLKTKNSNIDKLAQEIKNLKRPKTRNKSTKNRSNRCCSAVDLVTKVYAATDTNKQNLKTKKIKKTEHEKISISKPLKLVKRDAMTQVENLESPDSSNHCTYVEEGRITITEKAAEKETNFEYEDEVFEECDEESVPA